MLSCTRHTLCRCIFLVTITFPTQGFPPKLKLEVKSLVSYCIIYTHTVICIPLSIHRLALCCISPLSVPFPKPTCHVLLLTCSAVLQTTVISWLRWLPCKQNYIWPVLYSGTSHNGPWKEDKSSAPKVSFIRRFHCSSVILVIIFGFLKVNDFKLYHEIFGVIVSCNCTPGRATRGVNILQCSTAVCSAAERH